MPDGDHFLFHVVSIRDERRGIYLASVAAGAQVPTVPLFPSETGAVYSPLVGRPFGVLLAAANGRIEARPYDADGLRNGTLAASHDYPQMGAGWRARSSIYCGEIPTSGSTISTAVRDCD